MSVNCEEIGTCSFKFQVYSALSGARNHNNFARLETNTLLLTLWVWIFQKLSPRLIFNHQKRITPVSPVTLQNQVLLHTILGLVNLHMIPLCVCFLSGFVQ